MKSWVNFFRLIFLIIGFIVLSLGVQLYNLCEQQKLDTDNMIKQQQVESQANSGKFKSQQDQIERLGKDLEDAQQQIKDQNDALAQEKDALANQKDALIHEVQKRQQIENTNKNIQTSLVDIKAEADAIKQDMKGWQKDYVSVLAELENGINNIQDQIKILHESINSLNISGLNQKISSLQDAVEKTAHPSDSSLPDSSPEPLKK